MPDPQEVQFQYPEGFPFKISIYFLPKDDLLFTCKKFVHKKRFPIEGQWCVNRPL